MRIGIGYDVHRLRAGRRLVLGGVLIKHEKGLEGHSDADVLIHAVMDSLLGAMCLGDIGLHFPDNDPKYKDISSLKLLREVAELLKGHKYKLINLDCIVIAQKPKISPFFTQMEENISEALGVGKDLVNVKATTTEGLGFYGREEGIASQAVALIDNI